MPSLPASPLMIRRYRESDAPAVGRLIADTYRRFNLGWATPDELVKLLGPFRHADSADPADLEAVAEVLRAPMMYVADEGGEVTGVLRGRPGRLASLFVRGDRHRQGIGRRLVERFEEESKEQRVRVIHVASTLYAVPFYTAMGYRRTTGIRVGRSFYGTGLPYQPMKKGLPAVSRQVPREAGTRRWAGR